MVVGDGEHEAEPVVLLGVEREHESGSQHYRYRLQVVSDGKNSPEWEKRPSVYLVTFFSKRKAKTRRAEAEFTFR